MSDPRRLGPRLAGASSIVTAALWRARRVIGLRQSVLAGGVRYTERTAEPLHRAMSASGSGVKEYDAVFPGGQRMRLTATRARVYADLAEPPGARALRGADRYVRPGSRALVIGGGTGWAGVHLASLVAPSGAVVSLDTDEESIRFAQRRYRLPNVAYELGSLDALKGETDQSFESVVVLPSGVDIASREQLAELWRLVVPGGALLLITGAAGPDPLLLRDVTGPDASAEPPAETGESPRLHAVVKPAE